MKRFTRKSVGLAIGLALVTPWGLADAPSSVGGSLSGFSANAQGGQSAGDWGIPQSSAGQNGPGQASNQSGGGQNGAGQGKGPDAGGYGNGQNTQSGNGQNNQTGNGQNVNSQGKGPDAGGYGDGQNGQNGQNNQNGNGSGQNGAGQQNSNTGNGQGEHYDDGPTKNNSNNPDGDGSGHGEHYDDGPTKNNSNNPDGGDHSGSAEGEGPTKNNSNNPDGGEHGNSGGNNNGNGSGSGSSGGRGNDGGDFPPLDPGSDGQYDPAENGGDQQIPSNCAEANSECGQCVQRNEAKLQFNRRYLHVAWSMTHQTLEYTKQAIAFGDGVSEMSKSSLSWQLTGKPQIIEAAESMRRTYANKYQIYIHNMEEAMNEMTACEADNYSVQSLYRQFSGLYLDFVKARYQSPE